MLNANKDRLDYGCELSPPEGFVIDAAVATTYSLDLNALLAVPIALCFNNTLEGDLTGEKLALLEAMAQLKDKLKVFYQKGNVLYPPSYNRLFTLLEPCLEAVIPSGGAFSSFHPKLWLLRFIESDSSIKNRAIKYRLLVLSRNLTFDRSWDIALSLDGERDKRRANGNQHSWLDLFKDLLEGCSDYPPADALLRDLPCIRWECPADFDSLELYAGGPGYGFPVDKADKDLSTLLVVSPFVKCMGAKGINGVAGLQGLVGKTSGGIRKILCSRAEELNTIEPKALEEWECYSINSSIVDGEERMALNEGDSDCVQSQNLHAKLIVRQSSKQCEWFLGSANATSAALGEGGTLPRNIEVMAKLVGKSTSLQIDKLLNEWLEKKLFIPYVFESTDENGDESLVPTLRQVTHLLIKANWSLAASTSKDGSYDVTLDHDVDLSKIPKDVSVTISQLALPARFDLFRSKKSPLRWENASLLQLTAFVVVHIEIIRGEKSKQARYVIDAPLSIEGGDNRQQHLLQSLVDSPEKILNYIRLLLHKQPDKSQWLNFEVGDGDVQKAIASLLSADAPMFEQLMIASSRHPEVIDRIEQLMIRLKEAEVDIPPEFINLWRHFSKHAKAVLVKSGSKKNAKRRKKRGEHEAR